ncbi:membrane protein [Planomonospora sphaerica]|uniref:Membrane protein n=1 Tax=Planomonospora sphaerica TaxID=161355 RepID=A0A161LN45_9ACTN|nr:MULTISPECIES: DUF6112 family protein [Planomonospora]GAT68965.1 membrane protein [Planomonospora sphaerica]GGL49876.1 hypothetical protein GCM10014719_58900 [Planomonospora parontospora subsp. antibiotica]GII19326.1 hypothetical protein Ppa05_60520 [Planomonospora parontospora subsp. antibiotica]
MDATYLSEHAHRLLATARTHGLQLHAQLGQALTPSPAPPRPSSPSGVNLDIAPNRTLPGMSAFEEMVGGLISYALIGSLVGLVISLMIIAAGRWFGNPYASSVGRTGIFSSLIAGLLLGAGPQLVIWMYNIGREF